MAYQVYLLNAAEGGDFIALETEDLDMNTLFSVGDIQDIARHNELN